MFEWLSLFRLRHGGENGLSLACVLWGYPISFKEAYASTSGVVHSLR